MFHDLPKFALCPFPRGRLDAISDKLCQLHNLHMLWMRVEGPHNNMGTSLGSCVKWPSKS